MNEKTLKELSARASEDQRIKVLYIAGWGRSGSTILGRLLGQVEDFFLVGELRYIWDRGILENRLCSCGVPFKECSIWRQVVSRVFDANGDVSVEELISLRERGLHTRHVLLALTRKGLRMRAARMGKYLEALGSLYQAVQTVSNAKVIVDTSKFPSYGYMLQSTPGIELYVLHLVRDPRAVAHSWGKQKPRLDGSGGPNGLMSPHGLVESSLVWDEWNLAVERIWRPESKRYMLLRYEDLVASPRGSIDAILGFLGKEAAEFPFEDERRLSLEATHAFSGNPDRFQSGVMTIKPDERWRRSMSDARQMMVTALTWPGLLRYGYSLKPQREFAKRL